MGWHCLDARGLPSRQRPKTRTTTLLIRKNALGAFPMEDTARRRLCKSKAASIYLSDKFLCQN